MKREPAVAHQFYPGDPATLRSTLDSLIPSGTAKEKALAVVSPHAGYIYSGSVAGETFAAVEIPQDIVLMGPNHHGYGAPVALMHTGAWRMPLGEVQINTVLAQTLLAQTDLIQPDTLAHRFEHSLEVQVPFLQYFRPDMTLTPMVISHLSFTACQAVGEALAGAIRQYNKPVLIVASSDMTHYESRESATAKDSLAIHRLEALDPEGLYNTVLRKGITMCGIMPATIALVAALRLGATQARLVRYTDSGEASGDTSQVVGYAGLVIS
ncbi:MAG: AmmeMemoRadiSam system protein B [Desulfurivibrionaceae bacterium]|jgi:AmmeMemoRadiSam system protein B|nr:AmmeMemoRadiSam system protein B [Pseudomonadota bacterium]MCG2822809.1 AmmeMemoRadiSam system protein B [Desulfobulbaceae bacterium]MDP2003679.1 AmmeMemoRadiSam system protein B [Desulfurivibrionaceae bacterium]PKN19225.1 MAG: AmmeMemoRadiSam system protein B [Deltaproteobacteria bacterium HGW-Deltaproteobacteria-3]MBU4407885.1 AmmeMemoRadiSam system protein B [Pseudomonadota bacterium]